jgi:hypothetical protein
MLGPEYQIPKRQPTPEEVLALFNESLRWDWIADPDAVLTFETTIDQWQEACDSYGSWRGIGRGFNRYFNISVSDEEWCAVLHPKKQKSLGGVCELISRHALLERLMPHRIFGIDCLSAGAFMTILELLRREGAKVDDLSPSSELLAYTRDHWTAFARLALMKPGALPRLRIEAPVFRACGWSLLLSMALLPTGCFVESLPSIGAMGIVISLVGLWFFWHYGPRKMILGDLKTFRDLCNKVAAQ